MISRIVLALATLPLATTLVSCGGEGSGDTEPARGTSAPTSAAENEACRAPAGAMLDDAESAAAATTFPEVERYWHLVSSEVGRLPADCSPRLAAALREVDGQVLRLAQAWERCNIYESVSGTACEASYPDVTDAFVDTSRAIDVARALVDAT